MIPLRIIFLIVTFYTMIGINYAATTPGAPNTPPIRPKSAVTPDWDEDESERELREREERARELEPKAVTASRPDHYPKCSDGRKMKKKCDTIQEDIGDLERAETDGERKEICVAMKKFANCVYDFKSDCTKEHIERIEKRFTEAIEASKTKDVAECSKNQLKMSGRTVDAIVAVVISVFYLVV